MEKGIDYTTKSPLLATLAALRAHIRAAGPSQGGNCSPSGGSAAAKPQAWGSSFAPPGRPKARIAPPRGAAQRQSRKRGGGHSHPVRVGQGRKDAAPPLARLRSHARTTRVC